jgi:hypothetical protein
MSVGFIGRAFSSLSSFAKISYQFVAAQLSKVRQVGWEPICACGNTKAPVDSNEAKGRIHLAISMMRKSLQATTAQMAKPVSLFVYHSPRSKEQSPANRSCVGDLLEPTESSTFSVLPGTQIQLVRLCTST